MNSIWDKIIDEAKDEIINIGTGSILDWLFSLILYIKL